MPMEPLDAVRRITDLAAGSAQIGPEEPPLDAADLTAALTGGRVDRGD
ncbi:hypothetical protein HDA32_002721 [Spinactinospora alkalitolerans]|uniref:Uncharacterized protein n=1 Tax=Spinactinospora alkalitolerans TaxID=687207 RepID=A0A852TV83_9ACTN|nr:hypothetical protein [Spinactinospora alkalitolerans]NYE47601.1 hypothetical protein [Spinactinospora alkalitolerans]